MSRKHVPDLDLLESPLITANPFGSILGMMPGSALAERIFNDPESWQEDLDDDDSDLKDKDAMRWLAGEVETYHANGDELAFSPVDRDMDLMLKPLSERFKLASSAGPVKDTSWDGLMGEDKKPFLPLFTHASMDLSLNMDLRLSKIWDSGGKMFHSIPSPLSPAKELPFTKKPFATSTTNNIRIMLPPALELATEQSPSPILSPLPVASASTTWSILEWYGVHPGTPRINGRAPLLNCFPPTPFQAKPQLPHINASSLRTPSSPSVNDTVVSPPTPPRRDTPPVSESTPIRRLPIIPDAIRNTPSPTPTPAHTSAKTKSPERTPKRTPKRTPRSAATLPSASTPSQSDAFSPDVTPQRSGSLFTRSPPAGPRPRSGATPKRNQANGGRESPSFIIAPAPTPCRMRRPSPTPILHLGVPA